MIQMERLFTNWLRFGRWIALIEPVDPLNIVKKFIAIFHDVIYIHLSGPNG
jgi:hypothetical protein